MQNGITLPALLLCVYLSRIQTGGPALSLAELQMLEVCIASVSLVHIEIDGSALNSLSKRRPCQALLSATGQRPY